MTTTATAPQRAEGLELLGALGGSGYTDAPSMVRRADGQTLQLTPRLYAVLEAIDGTRTPEQIAAATDLTAQDVITLIETKLQPLGVLHGSEPTEPVVSNPLLGLRWKVVASNPATTNRLTAPFAALFNPLILWPVLAAFVGVCWFVLMEKGLASATRQAFDSPGLLLGVFALGVLSAGFHELGHAAACKYGGATPGAMGAGVYLVWPAFYTNVDDSYRLSKKGRLRVDLGGLYFNALVAVVVTGIWLATRQDALLLGVALQLLQMLRQLAPIIRADGYHILSDLTGVPDLFMHMGATLKGLLPWHWRDPSPLTRRARVIVTTWVLVVVPLLLLLLLGAVLVLPRLIATAWESAQVQGSSIAGAAESANVLSVGAGVLKLFALALPVLGTLYLLTSIVRRTGRWAWTKTEDRPIRRALVMAAALTAATLLLLAWWPQGQYRPVTAEDRGTLTSLVTQSISEPAAPTQVPALAMIPRDSSRPVLLMTTGGSGTKTYLTSTDGGPATAFPFTLPEAPKPGDTQALAVNDTDGSVVYDVAYALVTITDGDAVTNTNSAYALASCTDCTTVAVSFQVVLIIGQSDVVVPVNTAVAANSGCIRCVTNALAVQLVVTLKEAPSAEVQRQLNEAMAGMEDLEGLDAAGLLAQVNAVQAAVTKVLTDNDLVTGTTTTSDTASATPQPSSSPSPTPTATPEPSAEPSPTPSPSESPTPTPSP